MIDQHRSVIYKIKKLSRFVSSAHPGGSRKGSQAQDCYGRKAEPVSLFEGIQKTKAHRLRTVMGEKRVFLAFSEHGGVG